MKLIILLMLSALTNSLFSQLNYEVDIEERNKAIELCSLAKRNLEEGNVKEAFDHILESISLDSLLRQSYLLVYQAWLQDSSYTDKVECVINKGKSIFSDDDELCFYLAEIYRYRHDLPEAILEYTNATNYAKRNGEEFYLVHYYYFNRGNCFFQMEMYDGALADYNYTLKLKSDFAVAINNRAMCLYLLGKKEEACKDWRQALLMGYNASEKYLNKYCK